MAAKTSNFCLMCYKVCVSTKVSYQFGEIWHVDPRIEDILFFGRINSISGKDPLKIPI